MKAIVVTFDSLNRHFLPPYGNDWVHAPNFQRLANRSVTFDRSYVCSMPCMPARRDFHTGRPNFFLRGWGPLEPFDDSMPEMLKTRGVSTHLVTDHYHYFEDGGATYHGRYSTWQAFRGQEGDPWMGQAGEVGIPQNINGKGARQDWVNRQFQKREEDFSQVQTFDAGLDFLERNHAEDRWMLQIETFDPHEPFFIPENFEELYPRAGEKPVFDWPAYREVAETPEEIERIRHNYAALVSMCDKQLGRVLDAMDRHDLWKDTMLVVWTDHGFLLGEHRRWAKSCSDLWEEICHTPFFVWDPRCGKSGERRQSLVQPALDLAPTLLRFFGFEPSPRMTGYDLAGVIESDRAVREAAMFGYHNMPLHITDGKYSYIRYPTDLESVFHWYTLMPAAMRNLWSAEMLAGAEMVGPLPFTNGFPVMKIPRRAAMEGDPGSHRLFDLDCDPEQENELCDPEMEKQLCDFAAAEARRCHAPEEYFRRYGIPLRERPKAEKPRVFQEPLLSAR